MTSPLENADEPEKLRRIVIEPVSRVEGHGKVTILLDDQEKVHQVRLHIVEFRGFERFIQGRPYWEVPGDGAAPLRHLPGEPPPRGVEGARPSWSARARSPPTAEKIRRLMHYGQILQSHALHFYHLASPDLLFGFDSDVAKRNIVGVLAAYPGRRAAGDPPAQVRAGGHPHHRGQARARHRLDPRRREQVASRRRSATSSCRPLPRGPRVGAGGRAARRRAPRREPRALRRTSAPSARASLSLVGQRRQARSLRRRAARSRRRRRRSSSTASTAQDYRDAAPRERPLVELHEVPVHRLAAGRTSAGTRSARSRASRTATRSARRSPRPRARSSSRARRGGRHPRAARVPLGAHDRAAPRGRGHRAAPRTIRGPPRRRSRRRAVRAASDGRRHHRGAARHAHPPLRGRRAGPRDDVQPHRLDDAQQPGDERGDPRRSRASTSTGTSRPRASSTTSRSPSARSIRACRAPRTRSGRCRSWSRSSTRRARSSSASCATASDCDRTAAAAARARRRQPLARRRCAGPALRRARDASCWRAEIARWRASSSSPTSSSRSSTRSTSRGASASCSSTRA